MPKPEKGPIIIGVMGMTGTGKSTFINKLTNDPDIAIGTGLRSCLISPNDLHTPDLIYPIFVDEDCYEICKLIRTPSRNRHQGDPKFDDVLQITRGYPCGHSGF